MRHTTSCAIAAMLLATAAQPAAAAPALSVLGNDFTFPNSVAGLPAKLSDFSELQINFF